MRRYDDMSREELVAELESVLAARVLSAAGGALERALDELRLHELELERQNRELRETQHALEAAKNRYEDLYESAPVAYCTIDERGCIEGTNSRGAELFRRPRASLVGEPFIAVARMKDSTPFWRHLRRCMESLVPVVDELVLGDLETTPVSVRVTSARMRSGDGGRRCRCAIVDISDHKALERDLRRAHEAERALRSRLEAVRRANMAVSEAIVQGGPLGREDVLRVSVEQARELVDAEYASVEVREDPDRPLSSRAPAAPAAAITSSLEVPLIYHGESLGILRVANKRAARDFSPEDRSALELLAADMGIAIKTASLKRLDALRNAWLQDVIDQLPEPVLLAEKGGRIRSNRAAGPFLSAAGSEVDGFGNPIVLEARTPEGAAVPWSELPLARALVRGESSAHLELLLKDRSGAWVPMLAAATPVRTGGQAAGAVAVFQDVSQLKEIERLREQWTSMVAHDLRQPLGSVLLAASSLERAPDGNAVRKKAATRLREAVRQLNRMVGDLLDVARIESDRLKVAPRELALAAFLPELLERARHLAADSPVSLEVVPPDDPFVTRADGFRVEQVLGNLLENAARYGEPGGRIVVRLERARDEVIVSVTNHGPGLTLEECHRVFDRSYRSTGAEGGIHWGLGLGLYIARGIIRAHGGRIWVESTPGRTTTFSFSLPVRRAA